MWSTVSKNSTNQMRPIAPTIATIMIVISILVVFGSPDSLLSAANLLIAIQVGLRLNFFNTFLEDHGYGLTHSRIAKELDPFQRGGGYSITKYLN